MRSIDEILTFCVNLGRHMIVSGANLERVQLAIEFICKAYSLKDVSIFLLSTNLSVSAYDSDNNYSSRQVTIPPAGIHLERLKSLNQLSYKVAEITPPSKLLDKMLEKALQVHSYSDFIILIGRVSAMCCLCFMFGGNLLTLIPVALVTTLLHFIMKVFERSGFDKILINALTMCIAAVAAVFLVYFGIGDNLPVVLITISMLVIPGIPLVNAMKNLLCGREINGILLLLKIFIETMALALGIFLALAIFKPYIHINNAQPLANPLSLVFLSYAASLSFGIVFQINPKDLYLAGFGGALTRISLVTLTPLISNRLLFMTISALVAALYAEILAIKRRQPSTYFVYPAIIPLIPGDLFFYALAGFFLGDKTWIHTNGLNCLLSLLGLSFGFVLSATVSHYIRKFRYMYM